MPNKFQTKVFKVEKFEPKHLKESHQILEKHLKVAEEYAITNNGYKKNILKIPNIWDRIKHTLHLKNI